MLLLTTPPLPIPGCRNVVKISKPPPKYPFPSPPISRPITKYLTFNSLRSSPFPLSADSPHPSEDDSFTVSFSITHSAQPSILLDYPPVLGNRNQNVVDYLNEAMNFQYLKLDPVLPEKPKNSSEDRKKYNALRRRQIKAETEAWERAAMEYKELEREMMEKKLAPSLPYVKSLFLGWFEPLRDAIEKEQRVQKRKRQKAAYAQHIQLLPAEKIAVIVMYKMMSMLMMGQEDGCVRVIQAAVRIGEAIEQEFKAHSYLQKTKRTGRRNAEGHESYIQEMVRKRIMKLIKMKKLAEVQKLVKDGFEMEPWGRDAQAKLGSRLIELLAESAYVQSPPDQSGDSVPEILPAFRHTFRAISKDVGKSTNRFGTIECDPLVHKGFDSTAKHMVIPYLPMLVPSKSWKGYDKGGHLFLPSYVMRTHGAKDQQNTMKNVPRKQMQRVFEALDTLGNTKWRINKRVLDVVECIWNKGGGIAGLVDRQDITIPQKPDTEDLTEINKWRWDSRKAKKANAEMHAQRCDIELKLSVARKMKDEEGFYYPHNLDFRGRAYPMHSHLNHLSSDLCRGTLEFAKGKPLGKSGFRWLKIHLANKYGRGVEKLSYDGRHTFVENHLFDILDSAENPIEGKKWWLNAEDPFQCLAACFNLSDALKCSSPYEALSHLPIHQDGSCNGLQHYAALGRDSLEAASVNLVAGDKPADVYSGIARRVMGIMREDSKKDPTTHQAALLAKILLDQVDRKLVKQTVMTSVYGVTYVGAREQIKRRLEENGLIEDDRLLFRASCYAAKVTLNALGEMFEAARSIMKWLSDCAKLIASENKPVRWMTPLGLPVVQPYRNSERYQIRTSLQVLSLQREGDSVSVKKQKAAFPPNFVHSLDGSHMMMTAISCKNAGLDFAGVHDSFWTHACDVDKMNQILREKFVELYTIPILENLLEDFQRSFPTLTFPSLPDRGDFNLEEILDSPYFFN